MDSEAFVSDAMQEMRVEHAPPSAAEREKLLAFGTFISNFLLAIIPVLQKAKRPADDLDAIFQAVFDPDMGVLSDDATAFFLTNDQLDYEFKLGDYSYVEILNEGKRQLQVNGKE